MVLRLAEAPFVTIQGEGPNTGKPTTFVRFATCNMKCSGWPCDTEYSWKAEYRDKWFRQSAEELYKSLPTFPKHLCITGGEPLLQPERELSVFLDLLWNNRYTWDIFTNGSKPIPYVSPTTQTVVMDWKLEGSGEGDSFLEQRWKNFHNLSINDAVKFVCTNEADVREALKVCEAFTRAKIYFSPAWQQFTIKEIFNTVITSSLVNVNLERVYFQVQTHKYTEMP